MAFDSTTAITAIAIIAFVSGGFLIISGRQFHAAPTAAIWGLSNLFLALGIPLLLGGGRYELGFLCLLTNAALAWGSLARFENRRVPPAILIATGLIWIALTLVPETSIAYGIKAAVFLVMGAGLLLGAGLELWRGRAEKLSSRWPLMGLLVTNAVAAFGAAIAVAPMLGEPTIPGGGWLWPTYLVAMVFLVGTAMFLVSLIKERAIREQETLAATDALTGLPNRGSFMRSASRALDMAVAAKQPVAVALFDLDRFKAINDTHGHRTGDLVLQRFAEIARRGLRTADFLARIGGEEFAAVLPGASAELAVAVVNRVRTQFAESGMAIDRVPIRTTVSCGLAVVEPGGAATTIDTALSRADGALYAAKAAGRDRVSLAAGATATPAPIVRIA
ncbi:MAG: GGDEF domain-containing protein [Bauldia sp.]|nr:GGDEF domain-containing protein [Bauldia sp.]MCW5718920.1 GGDEF domain-containing protein [Bauldia sp.]